MLLEMDSAAPEDLVRHYRDVRNRLKGMPPKVEVASIVPDVIPAAKIKSPTVFSFSTFNQYLPICGMFGDGRWLNGVRRRPTAPAILRAVSQYFGISQVELLSARRPKVLVIPRQIAMHLCNSLSKTNLSEIGRRMKRDHTTILHGIRQIEKLLPYDSSVQKAVAEISAQFEVEQ